MQLNCTLINLGNWQSRKSHEWSTILPKNQMLISAFILQPIIYQATRLTTKKQ